MRQLICAIAVVAGVAAIAAPGAAQAATRPAVSFAFTHSQIRQGDRPQITYLSEGLPARATIYLQDHLAGTGRWLTIDQFRAPVGTVRAPVASSSGVWLYRIAVVSGQRTVAVSPASSLTVEPAPSTGNSSGSAANWALVVLTALGLIFGG
jgi:hypothetical protein